MSNCINSGIKRIFILTQFLSASLHRHIKQTYQFDRFSNGVVDILSAEQTISGDVWFQGTADAVRATLNHTTYYDSSQTLILSGDHLYRMDYSEFVQFHREKSADITIGVYPVLRSEAHHFGILRANPAGDIQEFLEKPKDPSQLDRFEPPREFYEARGLEPHPDHVLGSMGVYVFDTRVLEDLLCNTTYKDFGKEVIPSALGRYRVAAYPFTGYWRDIGTIRSFYEANIELTHHDPRSTSTPPAGPSTPGPSAYPLARHRLADQRQPAGAGHLHHRRHHHQLGHRHARHCRQGVEDLQRRHARRGLLRRRGGPQPPLPPHGQPTQPRHRPELPDRRRHH
jgi:glucose-1-phosphate adenylyltransferase